MALSQAWRRWRAMLAFIGAFIHALRDGIAARSALGGWF
jgi:hypothetical protein